jgi:hypothetical protein
MSDLALLDRAFANIIQRFVRTGQAPHFTELAKDLGLSVEQGRELVHELFARNVPGWVHPGTDLIASFAPFNNQPTQYRITIDGHQKWFAQWGFEALAVRWLFPNKTVRIDAPCLDCGEPLVVEMRDEQILSVEPDTMVGYTHSPIGGSREDIPFRWGGMNLFRSEEHARKWRMFKPEMEKTLRPLSFWADLFSEPLFRQRGRPDYVTWLRSEEGRQSIANLWGKMP